MADGERGTEGSVVRIGVPMRRWVPIAVLGAVVLDGMRPLAVGDAAWASLLVWLAVWLAATRYRARRTYVELTDSALVMASAGKKPLRVPVADILSIAPVTSGSKTMLVARTDEGALFALPTPLSTWWMWQGDAHFATASERVRRWFVAARDAHSSTT